MKDNIRRSVVERDDVDLPIGVFPAEAGPLEVVASPGAAGRRKASA
jgi:hypothetical protein